MGQKERRETFAEAVCRLDKQGMSEERITDLLNTTIGRVDAVLSRQYAKRDNAFAEAAKADESIKEKKHTTSAVCRFEGSCEWMSGPGRYCVWPSCFKSHIGVLGKNGKVDEVADFDPQAPQAPLVSDSRTDGTNNVNEGPACVDVFDTSFQPNANACILGDTGHGHVARPDCLKTAAESSEAAEEVSQVTTADSGRKAKPRRSVRHRKGNEEA